MQTGTIAASITVGGITFASNVSRQAEGNISHVVALPAGLAGAISATGVDGLATGHGLQAADVIDVHWTDPSDGTHKCRRGITIDTANANDIAFDETPAGAGDTLPAEDTAVVVSKQVTVTTAFDGDNAEIVAAKATQRGSVDFRSASASLAAVKLTAGEAWSWVSGQSAANPLTGDPVASIQASNGSTTAAMLYVGVLYQSV